MTHINAALIRTVCDACIEKTEQCAQACQKLIKAIQAYNHKETISAAAECEMAINICETTHKECLRVGKQHLQECDIPACVEAWNMFMKALLTSNKACEQARLHCKQPSHNSLDMLNNCIAACQACIDPCNRCIAMAS